MYREMTTYEHYILTKSLIENHIDRGDENSVYQEEKNIQRTGLWEVVGKERIG